MTASREYRPLSPEERQLLTQPELEAQILYDLGWGYRKIAVHLGIAVATVRDRLDRAAARVARHLDQELDI